MKAKLSARSISALKPQDKAYEVVDTDIKGFLLRIQPTGRMTFYYSYRSGADRHRFKIGVLGSQVTIQQARDKALQHAVKVAGGEDIQATKKQSRQQSQLAKQNTLGKFIENHYQPWAVANLKSGQPSVDRVNYSFSEILDLPLNEISISYIEKWRTDRLKNGTKPSTINRCVNSLRSVLTKAEQWEVIEEHPLRKLKALPFDTAPKVRYLSAEEERRLFVALTGRDVELKRARSRGNEFRRARGYVLMPERHQNQYADRMTPLITLSLKTGMRRGELFDLEWANVNLLQQTITVVGETAKSKKTRHIPLSPTALFTLDKWKEQSPLTNGRVFPADGGWRRATG